MSSNNLTHEEKQVIAYIRKKASEVANNRSRYKNPDARYSALLYFASCIEDKLHREATYENFEFQDENSGKVENGYNRT